MLKKLNKGTHVTIKGYLKPIEWFDKETGEMRHRVILAGNDVCILDLNEDAPEEPKKRSRKKQQ